MKSSHVSVGRILVTAIVTLGGIGLLLVGSTTSVLAQSEQRAATVNTQPIGQAIRVLDGDTLLLKDGRVIRLIGTLAPDPRLGDYFAQESKNILESLVRGQQLELWFDTQNVGQGHLDQYGRMLAYVYVRSNGSLFVNREMLRRGAAYYFSAHYSQKRGDFLSDQYLARTHKYGVWSQTTESPEEIAQRLGKTFAEDLFVFEYDSPDQPLPTDAALELDASRLRGLPGTEYTPQPTFSTQPTTPSGYWFYGYPTFTHYHHLHRTTTRPVSTSQATQVRRSKD